MVTNRSYGQQCGIANALDLVGERWALLVVRDLILGPKRFTDLRTSLPGIATNVLTQRLKQLERDGIVRRRLLPPPAASTVYELTEYGRELESALLAFGRWGAKSMPERTPDRTSRPEWFGVALKAYFQPEAARGLRAMLVLRFDDGCLTVRIDDGAVEVAAYEADGAADLTLTAADAGPVAAFLAGRSVAVEELSPVGDRRLLRRLTAIFPLRS